MSAESKFRKVKKNDSIFIYRKENNWYKLKSTDVNKYLKKFGNFTSKNFRTWVANLGFITELCMLLYYHQKLFGSDSDR